jgi:hypothetical protein
MKNAGFWDVTSCGSYKNRRFDAIYAIYLPSVLRLLLTANIVPSSPSLVALMMEAIRPFETSVLTGVTRRNIPEDHIFHSHRR